MGTTLRFSLAAGRLVVCTSGAPRDRRLGVRLRGLFTGPLTGALADALPAPDSPDQIAMKATRSRAAGSSHTGALRGLSEVAFVSLAWPATRHPEGHCARPRRWISRRGPVQQRRRTRPPQPEGVRPTREVVCPSCG